MMCLKFDKSGLTLVMFYSKELESSEYVLGQFKQLPSMINGCNFAMVNMNKNMELVELSKNTIAPISYVPDLTLFVNGFPFIRYDGEQDVESIRKFLHDIYEKIQKLQFSQSPASGQPSHSPVSQSPAPRPPPPAQHHFQRPSELSGASVHNTNQFLNGRLPPEHVPRPFQQTQAPPKPVSAIPEYTVGIPKSSLSNKLYQTFDHAYAGAR